MKKKIFILPLMAFMFMSAFAATSVGTNPCAVHAHGESSRAIDTAAIDCPDCEGTGRDAGTGCICDGTGECHFCEGTGGCWNCNYTGKCQECYGMSSECVYCGGTGRCKLCDGQNICDWCHGSGECTICNPCTTCDGTGMVVREISAYTIVGDSALMGSDWDETDTDNDMTDTGSGHLKLVKENVTLSAGNYEYRMVANHEWGIRDFPAYGNQTLSIEHNGTYTITFEGDTTELNASYVEVFASLEELVTKLPATSFKENVIVTITDAVIDDFYVSSKGYTNGIYVTAANTTVEIYCNDVPDTWEVGGKVSGTIQAEWLLYNGTSELQKWEGGWDVFTYTVSVPVAEIDCPNCKGTGYTDQQCQLCYGFGSCEHCDNTLKEPCAVCNKTGKITKGTLKDAIDVVLANGTITLLADNSEVIEISKEIVFTVDKTTFTFDKSKITAGTGYDVSTRENGTETTFIVTLQKTVADILNTVENGFPSDSDGNAPSNAWVNSNNEKMFSCDGDLYVAGDGDFVLLANTMLTKDGSNYKCTKDDATVTFVMDDGALVSIEIQGLTDCAKLNGTYTAPAVWPADAPTEAPVAPEYDGASLLGAPLTTNLEFEPLDWPGSMPEKLTFETGETIYYMEQMNWQIYTNWAEDSYDMSEYDMLHVDLFPVTDTRIIVEIEGLYSDDGGQGYKNSVEKTLTAGEWNGLDIALSEFPALSSGKIYDFTDVRYFTLVGDYYNQTALSVGNVYFYKAPHEHAIMTTHAKVEAKCVEAGHEVYYECSCGKYFSDEDLTNEITDLQTWLAEDTGGYLAPLGHSMTHHPAVAPTCTKDGNVEYWTCSRESGVYFANKEGTATLDSIVDPKIGHHYSGEVSYTWNNNQCTASWHCDHNGCEEVESETVTGVYVKDSDATTESNEKGHYVATFSISEFATNSTAPNSVEIPDSKLSTKGLSGGAIAGIVIGSVFGLLIIAFAVLYILWKRKNLNVPILSKVLTPAFRFINKLFFKTKLNDVEAKEAENKVIKE